MRGVAVLAVEDLCQKRGLAEVARGFAQQESYVPVSRRVEDRLFARGDQAHGANGRRGQDTLTIRFVIK